jgi:DNA-binding CsgD family transcriptional regulator
LEVQAAGIGARPGLGESWSSAPGVAELSNRQVEILWRIVRGDRIRAIATELFISESTVRNHLAGLYKKFGVHSRADLVARLAPGNS